MDGAVRVKFWGTRGSLAKPGRSTLRHGGNTSCVEIRAADGSLIVLDCGTGAHDLGQELMKNGVVGGSLLISHTHWDHIQGMPFFTPLFVKGKEWDVYGPRGLRHSFRQTLATQMQYTYFPVDLAELGATIRYHDLIEGAFNIGNARVTTRYLNHPVLTLGYRIEMDGVVIVYACDHEPGSMLAAAGADLGDAAEQRHLAFLHGADLLIHDAQFTAAEYETKIGWGHSTHEYVTALARRAGVKHLAISHHDPMRDDDALDTIIRCLREKLAAEESKLNLFAAADGQALEFPHPARSRRAVSPDAPPAIVRKPLENLRQPVLAVISDPGLAQILSDALHEDGLKLASAGDSVAALRIAGTHHPALILVENGLPGTDTVALCRALREETGGTAPVVLVADHEDESVGRKAGVAGWMRKSLTGIYARTLIRQWLLLSAHRHPAGASLAQPVYG